MMCNNNNQLNVPGNCERDLADVDVFYLSNIQYTMPI